MMAIDDSFKKPGAIPFKWEIRPGVPKVHQQKQSLPLVDHHRSFVLLENEIEQSRDHNRSFPTTPQKLTPPPAVKSYFQPPAELRTRSSRSFLSVPRTRSMCHRLERSILSKPEIVSQGCFLTPTLRRKTEKKGIHKLKPEFESEPGYTSDIETLSRWSVSSRKSLSPFHYSPSSSSFSSNRSSPRPVSDAEWAGFGLF